MEIVEIAYASSNRVPTVVLSKLLRLLAVFCMGNRKHQQLLWTYRSIMLDFVVQKHWYGV